MGTPGTSLVVGHLSKTLFITATSRDINKVRRLINMLGNRQEEIVHHVTNLWTLVNKTRSYVRETSYVPQRHWDIASTGARC